MAQVLGKLGYLTPEQLAQVLLTLVSVPFNFALKKLDRDFQHDKVNSPQESCQC